MPGTQPTPADLAARCAALPVFPLPRVVFIPHTLLPLHVFEPRYRDLVRDALEGDGVLGVPTLAPGWREQYCEKPALHPIMGIGRIVRHEAMSDGRSNIVLLGLGRARIERDLPSDTAYRVVQSALLEEPAPAAGALPQAAMRLRVALGQLVAARPHTAEQLGPLLDPERDAAEIADCLAHLALRDPAERQAYLETAGPIARIDAVIAAISGMLFAPAVDSD